MNSTSGPGADAVPGILPLDAITFFAGQPRADMDADRIRELADSIKEHGQVVPVLVRPMAKGRYQLIDGERRLRAVTLLGRDHIAAVIRQCGTDDDQFLLALVANVAREDLNPMELARSIRRACEMPAYRGLGLTERCQRLGPVFGRSYSWVYQHLKMLDLAPEAQGLVESGALKPSAASRVLKMPRQKQKEFAESVVRTGATASDAACAVERFTKRKTSMAARTIPLRNEECAALLKLWELALRTGDAAVLVRNKDLIAAVHKLERHLERARAAEGDAP